MTNFNTIPDRRKNINLTKWTFVSRDALPMWVADMDFPTPRPILNALHKVLDHGVLGYEMPGETLQETVAARMESLYKMEGET